MQSGPGVPNSQPDLAAKDSPSPLAPCRCGNPGQTVCSDCRKAVCSLCVRKVDAGTGTPGASVCLACRSSRIKLEEERRARPATSSARLAVVRGARVHKTWIYLPAFVVGSLAIMSSVVATVISEAGTARTEHRAREALARLYEAESAYHQKAPGYAPIEALEAASLARRPEVPGYELRIDVARDGHRFWARAVPQRDGLRGMFVDERGIIAYDGGGE